MKLEIACCNLISCLNAQNAGAQRIELFENISEGGCTPSYGMIKKVKELVQIPVYVMIRPRGGNFIYSNTEIEIMKEDILMCKELKVDGIVFGILNKNAEVDTEKNKYLLDIWQSSHVTFHRAFDRSLNLLKAAEQIIDLGFERILSSGGQENVEKGKEMLKTLHSQFGKKIVIMPGCGVNSNNALEIKNFCGVHEMHATCKISSEATNYLHNNFTDKHQLSEENEIKKLVQLFSSTKTSSLL